MPTLEEVQEVLLREIGNDDRPEFLESSKPDESNLILWDSAIVMRVRLRPLGVYLAGGTIAGRGELSSDDELEVRKRKFGTHEELMQLRGRLHRAVLARFKG